MVEDVEVQLLDFLCHDVRDDLLDGYCSQPVLAEVAVLERIDDEVVAVLLVLLHADDRVVQPLMTYRFCLHFLMLLVYRFCLNFLMLIIY